MSQTIVYSSESDDEQPEISPPPQKEVTFKKERKARQPLSEEQKQALRERLAKAREAKKAKRMPKEEVVPEPEPEPEPPSNEPKIKLTKEKTTKKKVKVEEPKVEEPVVKPKRKYVRKPKVTIPSFNPF